MPGQTYPVHRSKFPELGFYGLPGHTRAPRDILRQARDAEALGIGNLMISERADYKEIAAICGACAAVTETISIGTSATNLNLRHPLVTASMGSTLNRLSNGRFALGLAKGVAMRWRALGLDFPTYAREREFIGLLRRLWQGETIRGHQGELGDFGQLGLASYIDEDIPILYVGFGPKSLVNAGRIYDGVHLHTFMGDRALSQAVAQVRQGEREAGRAPGTVKVWSVLATACDASEERYLRLIVARLASYLQIPGYGEMLVSVNGWDADVLERFRADATVRAMPGLIDSVASLAQIAAVEKLLPESWRPAAVGDARTCAARWLEEFEAGADGIIVHASTPEEFAPVLREYERIRPDGRFAERTNRPA
ncbi:MAG: TIGR03857 family LLM class F420-dependent oxidoreductase [Gammaproteobacteria bacterium]|nr:TIGR03857 family LLM class F420-dependent oxidoreductase [Gammaproteobacteria bacterium]